MKEMLREHYLRWVSEFRALFWVDSDEPIWYGGRWIELDYPNPRKYATYRDYEKAQFLRELR